jgi:tetratricopeptide (TPR) repeat protein
MATPASVALVLGRLLRKQAKYAKAECVYRDALRNFAPVATNDFNPTSALLQELLALLSDLNKLDSAREYCEAVVEDFKTNLGPLHHATLAIVFEAGMFLRKHGQLTQAQHLYERPVALSESNLKSNDPTVFYIIHDLGVVFSAQGKLSSAEAIYQIALNGILKTLGAGHLLTLNAIVNLGGCYRDQGKLHDAARMYQSAASGFAISDPTSIAIFNQLTAIHIKTRNLEAAERACASALAGSELYYGSNHETTLFTTLDLGVLYRDQMKLEEARTTLSDLVFVFHNREHYSEFVALNCLGTVNIMEGRFEVAEVHLTQALDGFRALDADVDMLIYSTIYNFGALFEAQDRKVEAENSYQKALQGFQGIAGQRHISTLTAATSLAQLYWRQERFADAEYILAETLRGSESEVEPGTVEEVRLDANLALNFQRMTIPYLMAQSNSLLLENGKLSGDGITP